MSDDDDGDDEEGSQQTESTPQPILEDSEHDDDAVDELAAAASSSPRPISNSKTKVHTHAYLVVICFHALNERAQNVLFPLFSLSLSLSSLSLVSSLLFDVS